MSVALSMGADAVPGLAHDLLPFVLSCVGSLRTVLTADGLVWWLLLLLLPLLLLLLCLQALQEIVARGADPANIRVVAVVAAPPALKLMADTYPGRFLQFKLLPSHCY
jgi:hypothetical protein